MSTMVPLERVETMGLAGIPDVAIELGRMTAVIGTRGAGKSQFLSAIAWLLKGEPEPRWRDDASIRVTGRLGGAGRSRSVTRSRVARGPAVLEPADADLPPCTMLRAVDRLSPKLPESGRVGARLVELIPRATTDAALAEALVVAIESCCRDGVGGEVVIIEEPELLLTPQAQRYLYSMLRRFTENGNQVVYSTWSPAFVDAAHHEEIVRLDLHGQGVDVRRTQPGTLSDAERIRIQAEFDHERSEMFFAHKVVLVEGQTERLSLPFVFAAMGHDVDAEGISVVEMGGKGNLALAARLLVQLHIRSSSSSTPITAPHPRNSTRRSGGTRTALRRSGSCPISRPPRGSRHTTTRSCTPGAGSPARVPRRSPSRWRRSCARPSRCKTPAQPRTSRNSSPWIDGAAHKTPSVCRRRRLAFAADG
jgi:hypothetical protein